MKSYVIVCVFLFSVLNRGQTVFKSMLLLPDTGRTTSYTATVGEDHDYWINAPSYTNNNKTTITDNVICVRGIPSILAINDLNNNPNLRVLPNPFVSKITINETTGNENLELYDSFGNQIFIGKNIDKKDFSALNKGLYFLKIIDIKTAVLKLIKE